MESLLKIQQELKAPKGQYNKFGKYKYRSCEDILEAAKPICAKYGCLLTLSDEVVTIGDRYYIKATAEVQHGEEKQVVTAFAREEDSKKGMDASQITGTASSYARKYALNGLFCIDDTKDEDTPERKAENENRANQGQKKTKTYREQVIELAKANGLTMGELAKDYGLDGSTTEERFKEVLEDLQQCRM